MNENIDTIATSDIVKRANNKRRRKSNLPSLRIQKMMQHRFLRTIIDRHATRDHQRNQEKNHSSDYAKIRRLEKNTHLVRWKRSGNANGQCHNSQSHDESISEVVKERENIQIDDDDVTANVSVAHSFYKHLPTVLPEKEESKYYITNLACDMEIQSNINVSSYDDREYGSNQHQKTNDDNNVNEGDDDDDDVDVDESIHAELDRVSAASSLILLRSDSATIKIKNKESISRNQNNDNNNKKNGQIGKLTHPDDCMLLDISLSSTHQRGQKQRFKYETANQLVQEGQMKTQMPIAHVTAVSFR